MMRKQSVTDVRTGVVRFVWGAIGFISVLQVIKSVLSGEHAKVGSEIALVLAVVNIVAVFLGDKPRRIAAYLWICVAAIGFVMLILGAGLSIPWMVDQQTFGMILGGLLAAYLLVLGQ